VTGRFQFEDTALEEPIGLNMTPMVDVIFILLVFFLCVSQLKSGRLDIDLPPVDRHSDRQLASSDRKPLVVEVGRQDQLRIAGRTLSSESAVRTLIQTEIKKRDGQLPVILRGDNHANYGTVIRVFSLLQHAGIRKIEIEFEPEGRAR